MPPRLIGIAGLSGSGKTELARALAAQLNPDCEVLSLDSYYHDQSGIAVAERAQVNYDHPQALDWRRLEADLHALSRGEPIQEPRYLFAEHTRSTDTRLVEPKSFLLLEGILTLHREEIRALLDLKIFVITPPEECLRRRLERDVLERGRTPASVEEQYQRTVWPMALEFVLPSRQFADLSVSGEQPIHQSVEAVLSELQYVHAATA